MLISFSWPGAVCSTKHTGEPVLSYLYLIVGLILLIKGADWLVRGSSSVARRFRISEFIIGLTVVSFGTSLPELVIGLIAGQEGKTDLVIGNVLGSNIANVLLVLGIAAMIQPLTARRSTVWREIPFTLLASLTLAALLNDAFIEGHGESILSRVDGLVLLSFFCVFVYYTAQVIRSEVDRDWVGTVEEHNMTRSALEILGGVVSLVLGGQLCVTGAIEIASALGMSETFIGLTIVAIGTSLPELATSAVAAYRKNVDIAVGNVVGSNIFNIFIVLGITSVVHEIPFDPINNVHLGVMLATTVLLFVFMFLGHPERTIQRKEGAVFVALYAVYMGFVVYRG
ncbi:MAG: calcium/sodium antiporter [Candidatus Hydrogenedentes bacterium]|nr:calcium/sodium antiporter [Candidatus Hydrogenedentota bacterium]